jgi:homoserine O-acetyltransferase/O-succinyltransferase
MVNLQHKLVVEGLGISHLRIILGTSMGGMHTWLWSELHPTFMDGVMPIVSLPTKITGRNLLWRQSIIEAIKSDPTWQEGKYTRQPHSLIATWPFARMLLDGVPHLEKTVSNSSAAQAFIQKAMTEISTHDANDLIYVLAASHDYDPEPKLDTIQAKVFALDFSDDQLDPIQLHVLEDLIKGVKNGRAVIQPGTSDSFGHLTMAHPELWAHQVAAFMLFLEKPNKKY